MTPMLRRWWMSGMGWETGKSVGWDKRSAAVPPIGLRFACPNLHRLCRDESLSAFAFQHNNTLEVGQDVEAEPYLERESSVVCRNNVTSLAGTTPPAPCNTICDALSEAMSDDELFFWMSYFRQCAMRTTRQIPCSMSNELAALAQLDDRQWRDTHRPTLRSRHSRSRYCMGDRNRIRFNHAAESGRLERTPVVIAMLRNHMAQLQSGGETVSSCSPNEHPRRILANRQR